jgi:hypothetical protein
MLAERYPTRTLPHEVPPWDCMKDSITGLFTKPGKEPQYNRVISDLKVVSTLILREIVRNDSKYGLAR